MADALAGARRPDLQLAARGVAERRVADLDHPEPGPIPATAVARPQRRIDGPRLGVQAQVGEQRIGDRDR